MKKLLIFSLINIISININAQTSKQADIKDSGITIRTRCAATVSQNNLPLYIVDGKIVDTNYIKTIDPKYIASINVLKGKQATLQYGKKAINGVILIRTKKDILLDN